MLAEQKMNEVYTLIPAEKFPFFIYKSFQKDKKEQIGFIYQDILQRKSLLDIANTHKITISELNSILQKNNPHVGIYFQYFVARKVKGKVISEFYHVGVDVLAENNRVYSCKYCNTSNSTISFSQNNDLNNERNYAVEHNTTYTLALINPQWELSVILREIHPFLDNDKIRIRRKDVFFDH